MNFVISNIVSLKYQRFTPSGSKDIGIELVAKTQFIWGSMDDWMGVVGISSPGKFIYLFEGSEAL